MSTWIATLVLAEARWARSLHAFHEHVDCDSKAPSLGAVMRAFTRSMSTWIATRARPKQISRRAFTCSMSTWIATNDENSSLNIESLHVFHEHVDCDTNELF